MNENDENTAATEPTVAELAQQLRNQQAEIRQLQAELEAQRAAPSTTPVASDAANTLADGASTRRDVLRRVGVAGAAVAGAVAGSALGAQPVAAVDADPVLAGRSTIATSRTKVVKNLGPTFTQDFILGAADFVSASNFVAALGGQAGGPQVKNGVYGFSNSRTNADTDTGHALVAEATTAARSNLFMVNNAGDPTEDTISHAAGEMRTDATGGLWYCTKAGTPGTWAKLASESIASPERLTSVANLMLAVLVQSPVTILGTPFRVYDSRFNMGSTPSGRLAVGSSRVIPTRDARNVDDGVVTIPDANPPGSIGIIYTVTLIGPTGTGFVTVNPSTATEVTSSTLNFDSTSPSVQANTSSVSLGGDREIRVIAGGVPGGSFDFLIDIVGIYLNIGLDLLSAVANTISSASASSELSAAGDEPLSMTEQVERLEAALAALSAT